MKSFFWMVGAAGVASLLTVGCASKPSGSAKTGPVVPMAAEAPKNMGGDADFQPRAEKDPLAEALPQSVQEINRRGYLNDSFFDIDRYDVRTDQRDLLTRNASWLRNWPSVKIRIEGSCDERGTAQYNLALGERRAASNREYLQALGVDASRIEIVSLGKERPFASGHDEAAWSQNRRGHFIVIAR